MDNFDKLVEHFINTDQLGHYNKESYQITLYGIPMTLEALDQIKKDVEKVTMRYKIILHSPSEKRSNIGIIDIDL